MHGSFPTNAFKFSHHVSFDTSCKGCRATQDCPFVSWILAQSKERYSSLRLAASGYWSWFGFYL
uniref:Uncharacterized protein n=1 Tax=Medicago truncatula TaxID=3880 RepID=Q2HSV8_MEDTR|nr:hypothetical protein MtrDRAFT_AC150891g18v2 [Medicago truncatula]